MNKRKSILLVIILAVLILIPVFGVSAAEPAKSKIIHECALQNNQIPTIACFLATMIQISQYILGITGALALLFFVYGGFLFLTSAGKETQVTKGKEVLSRALIGVIIIFGAYLGITFLTKTILNATGVGLDVKGDLTVPTQGVIDMKKVADDAAKKKAADAANKFKKIDCVCRMSTTRDFSSYSIAGGLIEEIETDKYLKKMCDFNIIGIYDKSSNTCTKLDTYSDICKNLNFSGSEDTLNCSPK